MTDSPRPTLLHTRRALLPALFLLFSVALPTPTVRAAYPGTALLREPPRNWHLLDDSLDHFPGISAERAYRELLAGKTPSRIVIVAVIDGGVDTSHAVFQGLMWTNPKEIAGNGQDDDHNGYVDDVHGWNFMGSADGKSYADDLSEEQRVLTMCRRNRAQGLPEPKIVTARAGCEEMLSVFSAKRDTLLHFSTWLRATEDTLLKATKLLRIAAGSDTLSAARVQAIKSDKPDVVAAQKWLLALNVYDPPEALIAHDEESLAAEMKTFGDTPDPRPLVGDHYDKLDEHGYGNSDVRGPNPGHGTSVAAVIAGLPDSGTVGVARAGVRIMSLRTVPNGDERDKDVANAIRYAADNGANIINMSFGKRISPGKSAVDEAVAYADKKGVLMVHAAGNEGELITNTFEPYPNTQYLKGGGPKGWIEVGASSFEHGDHLAAEFSNYGKERVDLFAPGVEIFSAAPGGAFDRSDGTSLSSPVVSGAAAVLMAYYPKLTAVDVKRILLASAKPISVLAIRPGPRPDSLARIPFSEMSRSGGIVNLYDALKLAEKEKK